MASGALFPLEARGLTVRLGGHTALAGVDLALGGAVRTVVLGANGAGKSVLLRTLHGLIAPTEGVDLVGRLAASARRDQAMVFQRPVMLRRSALANIEYALAVNGVDGAERDRARARRALERVGLAHVAERPARRALRRRAAARGARPRLGAAPAHALPRRADREPRSRGRRAKSSA